MSGASIGQTPALWSAGPGTAKARRPLFGHASVAACAGACLDGLLGPERRKTGWMRAGAAAISARGGSGPCPITAAGMPTRYVIWCTTMP
ncbi:hypothetical protein [Benzoatithermus flavus]|uniref:hypothetical protein n=1 Tax=Benzoatithermus flavus TaxID=3108223 RepID=UPI003AAB2801